MDQAAKRGLKVTWVLVDNWHPVNGIDQYAQWAGKSHQARLPPRGAVQASSDGRWRPLAARLGQASVVVLLSA